MKYLKMVPLMLFPYMYLIAIACAGFLTTGNGGPVGLGLMVLYLAYTLISTVYNAIVCSTKKYDVRSVARINFIVKYVQIPAYLWHALLMLFSGLLSVWGLGILLFAVVVDVMTIALTGISAIGCSVRMKKEGIINTPVAILLALGNFIFFLDLIVAIVYVVLARRHAKKKGGEKTQGSIWQEEESAESRQAESVQETEE